MKAQHQGRTRREVIVEVGAVVAAATLARAAPAFGDDAFRLREEEGGVGVVADAATDGSLVVLSDGRRLPAFGFPTGWQSTPGDRVFVGTSDDSGALEGATYAQPMLRWTTVTGTVQPGMVQIDDPSYSTTPRTSVDSSVAQRTGRFRFRVAVSEASADGPHQVFAVTSE